MKIIICNEAAVEQYRKKTRKSKAPVVLGIIGIVLLVCVAAVSVLGNWTQIKGIFEEEEPVHAHIWQTASLKNASCVEDGLLLRVCEECHEEEKIVLPAYGHTMEKNTCLECGQRASENLQFQFKLDEAGEPYAVITGIGSCTDRHLVIPNVLGGISVTEIADGAFRGNTQIYSVSFHTGMKKIGKDAFRDCTNLYKIFLPEGLPEDIALGAFGNTAYANEEGNRKDDGTLQCNGYVLERTDGLDE